jgi:hypothetical protein
MKTYDTEGVEYIDHEKIDKQRGVISYLIKKIGTHIFSGKSVMNISLPIHLFDSRSMLEAFTYNYRMSKNFLGKIGQSSNIERLKLITVHLLTVLSISITCDKPFNPILGETFQAKIGDSLFYMEQTSHHPPIFNFYIKNPDFISYGYNALEAHATPNSASAHNNGKFFLKTNDGVLYSYKMPDFKLSGLMIGIRYCNYSGSLVVEDTVFYFNLDK